MKELYPEIEPLRTYRIETGGLHKIYVEESGEPEGIPVVFLHGGPGGGCNEKHRRYFNPKKYRIVIFDQRGTARSLPATSVEQNTTHHLIEDMETIRQTLKIDRWLIFGGSWGATLGLIYAETYPQCVLGMVLRGTFLARQCDLNWFTNGVGKILPDYWREFIGHIPEQEHADLILAYYLRVHCDDMEKRNAAVKAWSNWSGRVVTYQLPAVTMEDRSDMEKMIQEVTIETHYAKNKYFIEEDQILRNIDKLPDVPVKIIHGRRDMTCTLDASWSLHEALPQSEMIIVNDAGHLASEPPMVNALVNATDDMMEKLA